MSSASLSIFVGVAIALLAATQNTFPEQHPPTMTAADSSNVGDLMNAYKHLQKVGSQSDFYDKVFVPLLNQYKIDIIARCEGDKKKLDEMTQVFLLSMNSCDETLPTILAETLSYRTDLFPDVMQRVPDKQKSEFLHMLQIGVDNIEFEATQPGTPKTDADRVCKFMAKFSEYQKAYPYTK